MCLLHMQELRALAINLIHSIKHHSFVSVLLRFIDDVQGDSLSGIHAWCRCTCQQGVKQHFHVTRGQLLHLQVGCRGLGHDTLLGIDNDEPAAT